MIILLTSCQAAVSFMIQIPVAYKWEQQNNSNNSLENSHCAGGHVISAAIGAAFRLALKDALWLAAPLAMALALIAMQLTRTVHPPGQSLQLCHKLCNAELRK